MRWKDGYKYWNVRQIWQVLLIGVPFFHCIYLTALWYQSNIFASVENSFDNTGSVNFNKWPECERIIAGESSISAFSELKNSKTPLTLPYNDCELLRTFTWVPAWLSEEERSFPIAYSISAYESLNQLIRLLRLIYRPRNLYCVHIDAKASPLFTERASRYIRCFSPNVFLVPDQFRVNVKWGHFSVLEASLICANLSLQNNRIRWRYLLNVNEKELPLRTNWELVTALKALNGSNMVQLSPGNWSHRVPSKPLSFNITWRKGSFLVALRREFVRFMLTDHRAVEILEAFRAERDLLKVPDEMFFASLAYNPQLGAPGACIHPVVHKNTDRRSWQLARFVDWNWRRCRSVTIFTLSSQALTSRLNVKTQELKVRA
ncbi:hypothetical protein EG68_09669 [Paragonimus skrjabini miyazakii]|uniref:Beta-1,3-galactosyl-O-glycosyl-glycoprotein beta-1,6-N-acetylglucosaminyltransferase n=1 Tax=Paragonimus skrjabini miyazakii TaxID=59628 RepID=A0A8S9YKQ2_9TREM|nr:hypothetical protein EG68_09669 [Paragonimus skrjabini miyazakii]